MTDAEKKIDDTRETVRNHKLAGQAGALLAIISTGRRDIRDAMLEILEGLPVMESETVTHPTHYMLDTTNPHDPHWVPLCACQEKELSGGIWLNAKVDSPDGRSSDALVLRPGRWARADGAGLPCIPRHFSTGYNPLHTFDSEADAIAYAAEWGSYMNGDDPGACMYGFSPETGLVCYSEQHQDNCMEWIDRCINKVRNDPGLYDDNEIDKLIALRDMVDKAPVLPQ